jgi:hypothetical protein
MFTQPCRPPGKGTVTDYEVSALAHQPEIYLCVTGLGIVANRRKGHPSHERRQQCRRLFRPIRKNEKVRVPNLGEQ